MAEKEQLTKEEIAKYQKELDVALKKSDAMLQDFQVYIALYRSSFKSQVSHITKQEYEMLCDPIQCYKVSSLNRFYDGLSDDDLFVTKKAVSLNKDNIAMAFHPMVWQTLSFEERITAMRLAWKQVHKSDIKEFCNNYTTTVVFVGEDYKGSLNIASMLSVEPWMLFKSICNAKNALKFNYYFNNGMGKKYITDFQSFEEMQYISPLEPIEQDVSKMTDEMKAVFFNQLERRRMRENYRNADYLLLDSCEQLKGMFIAFDDALEEEIDDLNKTDALVSKQLGYFQKDIDEDYLSYKVTIFNNEIIKEHNELCDTYNALDEKIKAIKKPALDKTKELREKRNKLEGDLKVAGDAIEISIIEDELVEINKKINNIHEKELKKYKNELKELTDKRTDTYNKIQELKSHIITMEDAKEHFKDYFYSSNDKKFDDYKSVDVSKKDTNCTLSKEEYEKMN